VTGLVSRRWAAIDTTQTRGSSCAWAKEAASGKERSWGGCLIVRSFPGEPKVGSTVRRRLKGPSATGGGTEAKPARVDRASCTAPGWARRHIRRDGQKPDDHSVRTRDAGSKNLPRKGHRWLWGAWPNHTRRFEKPRRALSCTKMGRVAESKPRTTPPHNARYSPATAPPPAPPG